MLKQRALGAFFLASLITLLTVGSTAAAALDAPVLGSYAVPGQAKVVVVVLAGDSGAPAGFTVQWMRFSDYIANGSTWATPGAPGLAEASFTGTPSLNTWDGTLQSFALAPAGGAAVELGDLFDETGLTADATGLAELDMDTPYIVRAFANADGAEGPSAFSNEYIIATGLNVNCTYTQGYWKNHEEDWPVDSLTLGTVSYSKTELLQILNQPAQGNGLLILTHQLITAELNAAQGADTSDISAELQAAHTLVGSLVVPPVGGGFLAPSAASALTQVLDDYNNGVIGPGHCGTVSVESDTWAGIKATFR